MSAARHRVRFVGAGLLALVTTMALFLTMKVLVTGQDYRVEEAPAALEIDFLRIARDEDVRAKARALKRPAQALSDEPPPPPRLSQTPRPNIDKAAVGADFGDFDLAGVDLHAPVDGDALAIVRVLPRYPSRALSRGIEGWVLLEFTIDSAGQAIDPIVIDADPRDIFERAALSAVRRWKYRPMIENGKPTMRAGVRQLISFEIAP